MFNTFKFNTYQFNTHPYTPIIEGLDDIILNNYSLQNQNIITSDLIIEQIPKRQFESSKIPRGNGRIITGDSWDLKTIIIKGMLFGTTADGLENLMDDVKKNCSIQSSTLKIKRADGTKRHFIVTAVDIDIKRNEHFYVSSCPFEIEFQCLTPFGEDSSYTTTLQNVSDLVFYDVLVNEGNVSARPVFIYVVDSATSVTKVQIENLMTGELFIVTTALVAGDILKIDTENLEVLKNNVSIDYDGSFITLQTGANTLAHTITATAMSYALTQKFKNLYL